MTLLTLADAKTHLNISGTTFDTELQAFVDVACALVQAYADRSWDSATVTETHDGGGSVFLLRKSPISSITSVSVDGNALAATSYATDTSAGVLRIIFDTPAGTGNVSIVYAVGGTAPALATHAAKETVRHLWQTQRGSMAGRNPLNGDDYIPGTAFSLPRRVMELLDPIRALG